MSDPEVTTAAIDPYDFVEDDSVIDDVKSMIAELPKVDDPIACLEARIDEQIGAYDRAPSGSREETLASERMLLLLGALLVGRHVLEADDV